MLERHIAVEFKFTNHNFTKSPNMKLLNLFGEEFEVSHPHRKNGETATQRYRARIDKAIGKNIWRCVSLTNRKGAPVIEPYSYSVPKHFIRFDKRKGVSDPSSTMLHFYMYDCDFSSVLRNPESYIDELKQYHSVVFPDASQYMDMPSYRRMYNNALNKEIGQLWQKAGVRVVVNATWSDSESYNYCFEGLPKGCMIAINSIGIKGNPYSIHLWRKGYAKAMECLDPSHIIRYGDKIPGENTTISTYFEVEHLYRMHNGRKR